MSLDIHTDLSDAVARPAGTRNSIVATILLALATAIAVAIVSVATVLIGLS